MFTPANYSIKSLLCALSVLLLVSCVEGETTDQNASSRYRIEPAIIETRDVLAAQITSEDLRSVAFVPWVNPYVDPFGVEVLRREWIFTDVGAGFFRITNRWLGEEFSMAITMDGVLDKLQLAPSSEEASQRWKLTALDTGFCKITSELLGDDMVLDVDTSNLEQLVVLIRAAEQSDGQQWTLSQIGMGGDIDNACSNTPF